MKDQNGNEVGNSPSPSQNPAKQTPVNPANPASPANKPSQTSKQPAQTPAPAQTSKNKPGDNVTTSRGDAGVVKAKNYPNGQDKPPMYQVEITSPLADHHKTMVEDPLKG